MALIFTKKGLEDLNKMMDEGQAQQVAKDFLEKSKPLQDWHQKMKGKSPIQQSVEILEEAVTAPIHKVAIDPQPQTEAEALTQEYLILHQKLESIGGKELLGRMEALKKQLQSIANEEHSADVGVVFTCADGVMVFSPRATDTKVVDPKQLVHDLHEKFGLDVAFSVVKIGLTEVKKLLSEMELQKYVEQKPAHRTLKSVQVKEKK